MAFVPDGVRADLPPWKVAWWRTTLFLVQLAVEHPATGEIFVQAYRRGDREVLGPDEIEAAKRILRIWAEEKARLIGLTEVATS